MKIAIIGSAPSSMHLAPLGDPAWKIWGCSPGVYPMLHRCDAFFELHRWEPGVVGVASSQKQWFSPEYVQWMALRSPGVCPVWMYDSVPEIPASRALPIDDLTKKYGTYFFTSSIAIMIACAIDDILEERNAWAAQNPQDTQCPIASTIGLFGVDMAATEEYGYQRAGCQHFLLLAADLGIQVYVPPESDLLRPMPIYGIVESSHWHIKGTARTRDLQARLNQARATKQQAERDEVYIAGALDDHLYHMQTWGGDRDGMGVALDIQTQRPDLRAAILGTNAPQNTPREPATNITKIMGDGQPYTGAVRIDPKPAEGA